MQILIPLPQYSSKNTTYKDLKSYLKQLELAVHHAQKSVESAEKEGIELSDDAFIDFQHPQLSRIEDAKDTSLEVFEEFQSNFYDELQHIEIQINLE